MEIGILGGSFNPVHNGHISIAKEAVTQLGLDKVLFVVAYLPPHKGLTGNATTEDRVAMTRLAIEGFAAFEVSTYEIEKKGISYSVDTIRHFRRVYAGSRLYFIAGSDAVKDLAAWREIDTVLSLATFVICSRPGFSLDGIPDRITKLTIAPVDISSTQIRERVRQRQKIDTMVPPSVAEYMYGNKLYI